MPFFLMSAICLVILLLTGALNGACRSADISMPKLCAVIVLAVGLHYLTLAIAGNEFMLDIGALSLMLLPAAIAGEGRPDAGGVAAALVFSALCAAVEAAGAFAGVESGVLTGVLSGICAMLSARSPRMALLSATSVPVLSRMVAAFAETVTSGYSCLYLAGEALLASQLVAIFAALIFIYLERADRAIAE